MANPDHVALLKTPGWNAWREENPNATPDLTDTVFKELDLSGRNLARADLSRSKVLGCRLHGASMIRAAVQGVSFKGSSLENEDLSDAVLDYLVLDELPMAGAILKNVSFKSGSAR